MLKIDRSMEYFNRAKNVIPSTAQTFSKGFTQFSFGVSPIYLKKAEGPYIWDVDDNRYVDLYAALGPVILGHNYKNVSDKVIKQIANGTAFSLPHFGEVEYAEKLVSVIPETEMVRFGKNGSDVTAAAVRVSRAITNRERVACCGYHGWQDWFIGTTLRDRGVPKSVKNLTHTFEYNKIETLQKLFDEFPEEIACVILEPVGLVLPEDDFLKKVVELSRKNGAIVVFDECWTGFRLSISGARGYFGITPDLSCFGKAMGNGFPIAAVMGQKPIMEVFDEIFYSTTFGGDMVGIAAGSAVLKELSEKTVLEDVWRLGGNLKIGLEKIIKELELQKWVKIQGLPPKFSINFFNDTSSEWLSLKSLMQQYCFEREIFFGSIQVVSYAFNDSLVTQLLEKYYECFQLIKEAISTDSVDKKMRGQIVQPVFRRP